MADAPAFSASHPGAPAAPAQVRRLTPQDLTIALRQGWDDFNAKRGEMLVLALIYPLVGLIACVAAFDGNVAALAFPLAAGVSLLGPAAAAGFYRIAALRERGQDQGAWTHFFDVWKGRSGLALIGLTGGLLVLFMTWLAAAWGLYEATLGGPYAGLSDFAARLFTTPAGWALIVAGNLAGLVFAAVALAASAVSFPMIVDGEADPLAALLTSLRSARANPAVFARWGLTVAALLVAGSIPLFVGLAVVGPVLGYATWHLYTRAVVRSAA